MERLGAAALMRYPGLSKDPLDTFRRLRADLIRFARPFLTGDGLKQFARLAAKSNAKAPGPAQVRLRQVRPGRGGASPKNGQTERERARETGRTPHKK